MLGLFVLLVIFGGVALVTSLGGQSRRARRLSAEPQPTPQAVASLAAVNAHQQDSLQDLILRLPEPARQQSWELLCLIHDGLERAEVQDTRTRYLLTQSRQSYLPDTLRAYLGLTPGARRQLGTQGIVPEALLREQLELMQRGIEQAVNHDHAAADRLMTQGRFLRERFGTEQTDLHLPAKDTP